MTDAGQEGMEWVPRFGMLEVPRESAELIRGLFELAAWVADHPELPVPTVDARVYTGDGGWESKRAVVDAVAAALAIDAGDFPDIGHYHAETSFGPIRLHSVVITTQAVLRHNALTSHANSVQPKTASADTPLGGAR